VITLILKNWSNSFSIVTVRAVVKTIVNPFLSFEYYILMSLDLQTKMSSEISKSDEVTLKNREVLLLEDQASVESKVEFTEKGEDHRELVLSNGDINWNCPCLGGMAFGSCGVEFREAFSCFHYSEADPKGQDCIEKFADMHICMEKYPEVREEKKSDSEEASTDKIDEKEERSQETKQITGVSSSQEVAEKVHSVNWSY